MVTPTGFEPVLPEWKGSENRLKSMVFPSYSFQFFSILFNSFLFPSLAKKQFFTLNYFIIFIRSCVEETWRYFPSPPLVSETHVSLGNLRPFPNIWSRTRNCPFGIDKRSSIHLYFNWLAPLNPNAWSWLGDLIIKSIVFFSAFAVSVRLFHSGWYLSLGTPWYPGFGFSVHLG